MCQLVFYMILFNMSVNVTKIDHWSTILSLIAIIWQLHKAVGVQIGNTRANLYKNTIYWIKSVLFDVFYYLTKIVCFLLHLYIVLFLCKYLIEVLVCKYYYRNILIYFMQTTFCNPCFNHVWSVWHDIMLRYGQKMRALVNLQQHIPSNIFPWNPYKTY